ncbi:unnamed protein product [Candida verbasci]|uniref:ADF-H domain-containing protein n=1 Tax=Candida verbasci TaxID=1227364 RepID=A0A9W4U0Q6_9ASCO|nr:unnamed protein product [Candida verbasci]
MSSNLYTFSSVVLSNIKKFRFESIKSDSLQASIYKINKDSYEIEQEEIDDDDDIDSVELLVEELPDNQPRYIILSYPYKTNDNRLKTPLVLIYWIPPTTSQQYKMLYAGAVEIFRDKAGVNKLIKIEDEEEFESLDELIKD